MIINTKDYSDFKHAVGMLRHRDGVFYNLSVVISTPAVSAIWAFDLVEGSAVIGVFPFGSDGLPVVTATEITTDFPSAVALNQYLSAQIETPFANQAVPQI